MKKGLIGRKIGMTQVFDEKGNVIPVTVVELGPCTVVQKKTVENDGYNAVQLGFEDKKVTRTNKPEKGHFDKANVGPKKVLKEFRLEDDSALNVGDIIKADIFAAGEKVDVVGTSKGKGTAGAIKRWNFSRLKGYDHNLVDKAAEMIVEAAKRTNATVSGPIPLPTEKEIVTIIRSPHKYKDSREQFEIRTHKRLIDIYSTNAKILDSIHLPAGVDVKIKL